jgi:2-polyprenyl-3-methyl-5-hydroxy-6-metoxy-1,4-benzoquinol methylase
VEGLSPDQETQLTLVPRGNTQKHANRDVLTDLLRYERARLQQPGLRWLDAPCGAGEFLGQVRHFFSLASLSATDVRPDAPLVPGAPVQYVPADLSRGVPFAHEAPFEVLTSISGIMCFANTAQFVAQCAQRLRAGGLLLISNDNCLTVRDRLSYLHAGRVRRFKLLFEPDEGNFQLVQH